VIGYETSEQLDVELAKYFVRVTKREKRPCKRCAEQGVRCPPPPPRIIEKGLASDRVVINTVVSKYADHLPLYRQSVMLEREIGLEISRATFDGWVMRVGELLRPISGAMALELLAGNYIQADEAPVGVQSERVRGKNHQAYPWQYSRPGAAVVFDFRLGREREGPKAMASRGIVSFRRPWLQTTLSFAREFVLIRSRAGSWTTLGLRRNGWLRLWRASRNRRHTRGWS
jgi:transposase